MILELFVAFVQFLGLSSLVFVAFSLVLFKLKLKPVELCLPFVLHILT